MTIKCCTYKSYSLRKGVLTVYTSKSNRIKVGEYVHLSDNLYLVGSETKDELGYISVANMQNNQLDSTTVLLLKCKCKKGIEQYIHHEGKA